MNIKLEQTSLGGYRVLLCTTVRQEETLEHIVPDAMEDIHRIVHCTATPFLRQKETGEGSARVSGSLRAAVVYEPEGSGEPCALTVNLPFVCTAEHPSVKGGGHTAVKLWVLRAEARALNPRKILVRAELAVEFTVYGECRTELCAGAVCGEGTRLETQMITVADRGIEATAEKHVTFSEVIGLSALRPRMGELLWVRGGIHFGEAKVIGSRLVIKGAAEVSVLYSHEGGVASAVFQLPYTQMLDVAADGEESSVTGDAVLTGLHCTLREDESLEVTVEALLQAAVRRNRTVSFLEDAYSVGETAEIRRKELSFTELLDEGVRKCEVRKTIPLEQPVRQVVECVAVPGPVSRRTAENGVQARAEVYVTLLCIGEENQRFALTTLCEGEVILPWFESGTYWCRGVVAGEVRAIPIPGGVEVQGELTLRYRCTGAVRCPSVEAVIPMPGPAGERAPSVKVLAAETGDSLWDIGKRCRVSVEDIRRVNGLAGETVERDMLLLVPGSR